MISVEVRSLTQPVGIIRILATILTCLSFSLVAIEGYKDYSYWGWCMFTWCFCCFFTLLILTLEFTTLNTKVPFAWDDFTAAFAVLATIMCLTASIIYPIFFTKNASHITIGATVVSWLCFALYAGEVALTYLHPSGENSGFLSTVSGLLKMLETFLACLIFTSLDAETYYLSPGLQWCVAVYSICFIFTILIILLCIGQLVLLFPAAFDKLVTIYNIVAALMYMTAMVMWPLYSLQNKRRPDSCELYCPWDKLVVVTFMTVVNFIVYTMDSIYSVRLVFCTQEQ
ncbi:hypothetical protein LDENG_00010350 [Lucifuga dentata]|nr:hypothetical protein LDENG_00010350 [Lucifuga dentata]